MEFFTEKDDGKYSAKIVNMSTGGKPVMAIVMGILPVIIFGAIFLLTPQDQGKGGTTNNIHIIIAAGIFILASLIGLFIRKAGFGAGITVDQMERSITFKRPGTQKRTMDIDSFQKILLKTRQSSAAVLSLVSRDGNSHLLGVSRNPDQMRRMADELSTLISVTVSEEAM
ncbi:MAG: hypothetical protein KAH54_08035 [Candidatus Sabulitectum sp.]|nr:hypothetical protein [Candidatus Sabulitectum sp.]